MRKSLPVLAGLSAALLVPSVSDAAFTGLKFTARAPDPANPRLFICNLYASFDNAGDRLLSVNGLPAGLGPGPLVFSTNNSTGFHQEVVAGVFDTAIGSILFGIFPQYGNDTYLNIGLKNGESTDGVDNVAGNADDVVAGDGNDDTTPIGLLFAGWNGGGKSLQSDPAVGGALLIQDTAPFSDQHIAGTYASLQVFIGQFAIDTNGGTNDGLAARIDALIPNLIWQDSAGTSTLEGFDPGTGLGSALTVSHIVPAPGTLVLLGLAGLAGVRRRRR